MSEVVAFSRWQCSRICTSCEEGEICRCAEGDKTRLWLLAGTSGAIEQFYETGPYYGTWNGGRTGAMLDLDATKAAVEKAVWHD